MTDTYHPEVKLIRTLKGEAGVQIDLFGTRTVTLRPVSAVRLAYAILEAVNDLPGPEFNAVMAAAEENQ